MQLRCGQPFDYDACCNEESGCDSKCPGYGSHGSFLETDVAGKHIWLNAPFAEMPAYLDHYLACKAKDPHHTSACIVVPKGAGHWKKSLSGMELLHEYSKGECLLVAHGDSAANGPHVPCGIAVQVYYDPPVAKVAVNAVGKKRLTMQFGCAVAGVSGSALMDSGAEDQFISEAFAKRAGITVLQPETSSKVVLPDGSEVPVLGKVRVKVSIQKFSGAVHCWVVKLDEGFSLILGEPWLKHHGAVLNFGTGSCALWKGSRKVTLAPDHTASAGDKGVADSVPRYLSAVQVKRALRDGCDSFLVSVSKVDESQEDVTSGSGGTEASSSGLKPVSEWVQDNIDVFPAQLPDGLPPERGVGHTIPLMPGSEPTFGPMYRA